MLHTSLDAYEYRYSFKGTVGTPTVALERGYYLQTAHLESGALAFSLESQPASKNTEGGKNGKLTYFSRTTCWYQPDAQFSVFVGPHEGEVLRY